MRCCSILMPVSFVNCSISPSITLPSAPVSPFQYVIVGFAWAPARRATAGAAATAPSAPPRNRRRLRVGRFSRLTSAMTPSCSGIRVTTGM